MNSRYARSNTRAMRRLPRFHLLMVTVLGVALVSLSCAPRRRTTTTHETAKLPQEIVTKSLSLARDYVLRSQRPEGNFRYEHNFRTGESLPGDNQVRQAGTLWAVAVLNRERSTERSRKVLRRGLSFFQDNSRTAAGRGRYVAYPGAQRGATGSVALVGLALVEAIQSEPVPGSQDQFRAQLQGYIRFLLSLRKPDGRFAGRYDLDDGRGSAPPSPYSDGETLLLLTKAAPLLNRPKWRELAIESARGMHETYVRRALADRADLDVTKGFYQWGTMTYFEMFANDWADAENWAERGIRMGEWMIDVHHTLWRRKNTAYAHEGLAVAWELARRTGRTAAMQKIGHIHHLGLRKLISWQVGGPLSNRYLQSLESVPDEALGGVMNSAANPVLRIDVTQHFSHALILTRRFMYGETEPRRPSSVIY